MNTWLSWRPDQRLASELRRVLRLSTRVSHHLFSVVGGIAVLCVFALWTLPSVRGTLAARLMPFVVAAVQAGPVRLLHGQALPSVVPQGADDTLADNGDADGADAGGVGPVAAQGSAAPTTLDAIALGGADPHALPSAGDLAKLIPTQRIAADARDDRALVSAREQALVATYLSRRYRVAQEPVGELVKASFQTGREVGLDPLLLLAVMAIESGFNPYAESGVGAQGLMQVMAKVHSDKFQYFGGQRAALDPRANIKVGALVLKDCIARGGSVAGGLRLYVGSTTQDDGGYGAKVIAERARLRDVARGRNVPVFTPPAPAAAPAATAAAPAKPAPQRVQATLDAAHPLTDKVAKAEAADEKAPAQSDASAPKHPQTPELGA